MSTVAWLRSQRDRPINPDERRNAMAAVVVLLALATLVLYLTKPTPSTHPKRSTQPVIGAAQTTQKPDALTPAAEHTATVFLRGYLRYIYGHGPARQVKDTAPDLTRSLAKYPPRVSPSMRHSDPRVIALQPFTTTARQIGVRALVNDGGLIDYPIRLLLTPVGPRLLVTGLDGA